MYSKTIDRKQCTASKACYYSIIIIVRVIERRISESRPDTCRIHHGLLAITVCYYKLGKVDIHFPAIIGLVYVQLLSFLGEIYGWN